MPQQPLRGRRALITGSTGGLGLAMAWHLARAGCDLMLNGIDVEPDFAATCSRMAEEAGVNVHCTEADLASGKEVVRLVETTQAELGGLDILINNAVVRHFAPIVDFPTEKWDAALAVNLSAAFHALRSPRSPSNPEPSPSPADGDAGSAAVAAHYQSV
jgi:3-hydroxybutyrate dehydrogenase